MADLITALDDLCNLHGLAHLKTGEKADMGGFLRKLYPVDESTHPRPGDDDYVYPEDEEDED